MSSVRLGSAAKGFSFCGVVAGISPGNVLYVVWAAFRWAPPTELAPFGRYRNESSLSAGCCPSVEPLTAFNLVMLIFGAFFFSKSFYMFFMYSRYVEECESILESFSLSFSIILQLMSLRCYLITWLVSRGDFGNFRPGLLSFQKLLISFDGLSFIFSCLKSMSAIFSLFGYGTVRVVFGLWLRLGLGWLR